jgi:lycopene epsilon-cyclase
MPLDDPAPAASNKGSSNGSSKPTTTTTTRRVFLEETCLVAKPALPFAVLKRRLQRRLDAMGVRVVRVHEEEWSYIPVGGPLPVGDQALVAFGAAANLVHPATGFSVSRSLREAPGVADAVALALKEESGAGAVLRASRRVWRALWPAERRRQAAFHLFGMELLAQLDLPATNAFFRTFFALPGRYWRGFLASRLSSADLVAFALVTFVLAPLTIKARLVTHLLSDPAGKYLADKYLKGGDGGGAEEEQQQQGGEGVSGGGGSSSR